MANQATGTLNAPGRPAKLHARLPYLPGLDGLRALAVLAVLFYHADTTWLPGGFLGVDVFFVISGYLITSLLLVEWRDHRRIDLPAFWLRRARRLLPALFVLIALTLCFADLFLYDEVAGLRSDALAALGYVSNWYLIFSQKSYFEAVGRPSLFRHLWSLAVEEQFYLIWPVVFAFVIKRWGKLRLLLGALAGVAASSLLMALLYQPDVDPSRLYYGTDTRATGLLAGAALAMLLRTNWLPNRKQGLALDVIGVSALGILVWFFFQVDEFNPMLYQAGFLTVALVTVLLIAVVVTPNTLIGPRLLGWMPLRWIGLRSYGLYLWHWPVFMVTRPQLDLPLDGLPLLVMRLAITFLLVELSYRFVEVPVRSGALGRAWHALVTAQPARKRQLIMIWSGMLGAIAFSLTVVGISVVEAQPPAPPSYMLNLEGQNPTPSVMAQPAFTATPAHNLIVLEQQTATQVAAVKPTATRAAPGQPAVVQAPGVAATPTPVPVPPTATPIPDAVTRENANMRTGPGTIYDIVSSVPASHPVSIIGRTPNTDWFKVRAAGGAEGWILASLLQVHIQPAGVPLAEIPPQPPPRITMIGDSVMLSGSSELQKTFERIDLDAEIGRQAANAVAILQARASTGQLGQVVVVDIGNNGPLSAKQFDEMMQALKDVRLVVFLTVKVPQPWQAPNNRVIVDGVRRYPNAVLADWYAVSAGVSRYFWDDGIHLRPEGAKAYAQLIAAAIRGH